MNEPQPIPSGPVDGIDDELLVAQVRAGDLAAFELLMRRYNQRLYRVARSVLHDASAAEDAAQEAWIKAYTQLDRFQAPHRFGAWLSRIAFHEALMQRRGNRRLQVVEPATIEALSNTAQGDTTMSDSDPQKLVGDAQVHALLEGGIDRLPENFRTVFVLRAVEQLSVAETAAVLEIPEATVKTRFHRARGLLREALQARIDGAQESLFGFAGHRCDRMVANVMRRLREAHKLS